MNKIFFSEHLLEIRYEPYPRLLDKRGEITTSLANSPLKQWKIGSNRIDFISDHNNISAFISYKNLGLQSSSPNNSSFFISRANEFIKNSWPYFPYDKITRIGVKSSFLIETKNFTDTFNRFVDKFLGLTKEQLDKFGGTLIDVGFPMDFIDGENYFHVVTGPMEKDDINKNIESYNSFPESSLLVEVDYFTKTLTKSINPKRVYNIVESGVKKAQDIEKIITEILA